VSDAFQRPAIEYTAPQGIIKMGMAVVDGDPQNIPSQGYVCYGNPLDGSPMTNSKWTLGYYQNQYMLLEDDLAGYWYMVDFSGIFLANATGAQIFKVDRPTGAITTVGSHTNKAARIVAGPTVVNAQTDYKIIYDTAGAGGALTLPVGVDGMEFIFSPKSGGAATYTLTPSGGNTIDASITNPVGPAANSTSISFFSGTWYLN